MNEFGRLEAAQRYTVPGLERGLRILTAFTRREPVLSAPDLARRLSIPRSTVFRLLSTLEQLGLVERDESGRDYRLGTGALRLGFECLASKELTELGRPILERLRDITGCSCNLVVRDGRSVVYVARAVVQTPYANTVHLGTRLPAHATLFGRVLLRDLSFEKLQQLYPEEQLQAATPKTPATVAQLYRLIQTDRTHDYVFDQGYFEPNISTLAVPVFGQAGKVVAALGITVSGNKHTPENITELARSACEAADDLSGLLDHVAASRH